MKILVCNTGSTSLKFKLYEMPGDTVLSQGKVERVGSKADAIFQYQNLKTGFNLKLEQQDIPDYRSGINHYLNCLTAPEGGLLSSIEEVERVGFKTTVSKGHLGVHELTDEVLQGMRDWITIAPLHNPAYIQTIETMREMLPGVIFLGVFETAFHHDIPLHRRLYGVPYEWYENHGVQRLGYHGASHSYIADWLGREYGREYRAISCHLGGSSSICAIENGVSVDTSFGMTLESGLIHANRVGDMDPDIYRFLETEGLSQQEIDDGMTKTGGLLGLSGVSGDLRYVEEAAAQGNTRAQLAIDVFVSGIVHYIGAFYMDLGGLDYLVFTAGIGENSDVVRRLVCEKLAAAGVVLDQEKNQSCKGFGEISEPSSQVKVLVIPTDEELGIARRTFEFER
ncbi:acetate/propionate family kinase [Oscillospiraceae bacterium MB08-C2-2]|nr:acetate/propionate family kinase [Oscillospiraceae bacterium MB08-C2-2]